MSVVAFVPARPRRPAPAPRRALVKILSRSRPRSPALAALGIALSVNGGYGVSLARLVVTSPALGWPVAAVLGHDLAGLIPC
jgi:hypothetical protein